MTEFAKKNDKIEIVGAALQGQVYGAEGVDTIAKLPSLDEARAQLVGLFQTPAQRLVTLTQEPGSQLARVLQAYADKDEAA